MNFNNSKEYFKRAVELIPTGTQTSSKMPNQFAEGLTPKFIDRGDGAYLWDIDENRFIDYVGALGPIILGYNYHPVNEAIRNQLKKGIIFSLGNILEVELAGLLRELIPSAEMVRFGKNGNDVTSAAVRIARAYTKRDKIAICGYHGWQDWYIITTTRNRGIPEKMKEFSITFAYNDINSLEKVFADNKGQIAAVIMEPVGVVEPESRFLEKVKDLAHQEGAVLIFDEVKTGFRCHLGGAQALYGVTPDMSCFGKAMANGMPLSALVGKREIMMVCEGIFFSMQAAGELLSIAASIATIKELKKTEAISKVFNSGSILKQGCKTLITQHRLDGYLDIFGLPHYTVFEFRNGPAAASLELKTLFIQESIKRGVLTGGYSILSLAHTREIIAQTLDVYDAVFAIIRKAIDSKDVKNYLECPVVGEVFRRP